MNCGKNRKSNEEGKEHIEALSEALLEHAPVRDGVDDVASPLLLESVIVGMIVVPEESLKKIGTFRYGNLTQPLTKFKITFRGSAK